MNRPRMRLRADRTEPAADPQAARPRREGRHAAAETPQDDPFADRAADWAPVPVTPRAVTLSVATVATTLLVAIAALVPVPYAISSPGPTRDTLGDSGGTPLITVEDDTPTYESTGELRLTTVSVSGGPGYPVTLLDLVGGWLDPARAVRPVEEVFAPDESQEEIDERNQASMVSSQENATVAALEELGYEVPAVLDVEGAVPGTGAVDVVEEGDVIVSLEGQDLAGFSDLTRLLDEIPGGTTVTLGVLRGGEPTGLEITTTDDGEGGSLLGVYVDPEFDLPVDVQIQIENIGGPSAGMMFALGIVDRLTEADETGGLTVAGTGTMDSSGEVGPIGGIRQKLVGALRDGATWFLAPEDNCGEVVGHVPDGLRVVSVSTLAEARDALEAIGAGDGADLPSCGG
ncbi:S16 family serine protease [Actinotalea sp. AC32]|nr:S16 family serine protease [Actinotalea sp. AC32]